MNDSFQLVRAIIRRKRKIYCFFLISKGESIANENAEIKADLTDACREARSAGEAIKRITCVEHDASGKPVCVTDRQSMVQAARGLLSAVTRVLLLADMVVVKQIVHIKKKVMSTLNRLETVTSFSEFVKLFSVYGSQMVELAHLTGDRQNVIGHFQIEIADF